MGIDEGTAARASAPAAAHEREGERQEAREEKSAGHAPDTPGNAPGAQCPPPPRGYQDASIWDLTFFSYVNPLLSQAAKAPLEEHDADWMCPADDTAELLAQRFDDTYDRLKASRCCLLGASRP